MDLIQKINQIILAKKKIKVRTDKGWSKSGTPVAALTTLSGLAHEGLRLEVRSEKGNEMESQIFLLADIIDVIEAD